MMKHSPVACLQRSTQVGPELVFHRRERQKVKVGREMGWRTKVSLLGGSKENTFLVIFVQLMLFKGRIKGKMVSHPKRDF